MVILDLWLDLSLNKYSLTCTVTPHYVLYETFRNLFFIVNSGIFTSYSDIFSHIVAYLELCGTLVYSEGSVKGIITYWLSTVNIGQPFKVATTDIWFFGI